MYENFLTLRKLVEILNCCNEAEVYLCERIGAQAVIYKYRNEKMTIYYNDPASMQKATRYLTNELFNYLKEGGLIEK